MKTKTILEFQGGGASCNPAPVRVSNILHLENSERTSILHMHSCQKYGFTLAEVLITLGIIGIVTAMTLPSLVGHWKDKQFKTAYKKAYSDLSQVLQEGIVNQQFVRTAKGDTPATTIEYELMKSKFKVISDCPYPEDISKCWKRVILFAVGVALPEILPMV